MVAAAESAINGEDDKDYWCPKCRKSQEYKDLYVKPKKAAVKTPRNAAKKPVQKQVSASCSSGSTKNQKVEESKDMDNIIDKKWENR